MKDKILERFSILLLLGMNLFWSLFRIELTINARAGVWDMFIFYKSYKFSKKTFYLSLYLKISK